MGRKRRRKKKERPESLQVDLLEEQAAPSPESVPGEEQSDAPTGSREVGERWAKAVGQLKPARTRSATPASLAKSTDRPPLAAEAPDEGRGDKTATVRAESASAAHDHAATVRPAGEPLARARDLVKQGRIQEAIELYLGILTVNPSNLKAHNNLGVLLDELKRFDAALEHFQAAVQLAPENVEVLVNYASTLTSLARYELAEEVLRRAQRLATEDVRARLGIGILYFRRGLYAQAETELGWVLGKDEGNGSAHYYRGEALNRLGRFDESAEELRRAVQLDPDDPRAYYTLGHLYDRQNRLEDAAEMYREARRRQAR